MPVYEYECSHCRVVYEALQRMRDAPLTACPKCRRSLRRLVSAPKLNVGNLTSPSAARYARMDYAEEVKREKVLQRSYESLKFPPGVKHDPDDEH